jgi:hypothetical protein
MALADPPTSVTAVVASDNRLTLEGHDLLIVDVGHGDTDEADESGAALGATRRSTEQYARTWGLAWCDGCPGAGGYTQGALHAPGG